MAASEAMFSGFVELFTCLVSMKREAEEIQHHLENFHLYLGN